MYASTRYLFAIFLSVPQLCAMELPCEVKKEKERVGLLDESKSSYGAVAKSFNPIHLNEILPADSWLHIMEYLSGHDKNLQLFARIIVPNRSVQKNILKCFLKNCRKLTQAQRRAYMRIFYKTAKYPLGENRMFHIFDEFRILEEYTLPLVMVVIVTDDYAKALQDRLALIDERTIQNRFLSLQPEQKTILKEIYYATVRQDLDTVIEIPDIPEEINVFTRSRPCLCMQVTAYFIGLLALAVVIVYWDTSSRFSVAVPALIVCIVGSICCFLVILDMFCKEEGTQMILSCHQCCRTRRLQNITAANVALLDAMAIEKTTV